MTIITSIVLFAFYPLLRGKKNAKSDDLPGKKACLIVGGVLGEHHDLALKTGHVEALLYHGGAVLGHEPGDGVADAPGGAGDDGNLAGQIKHIHIN